MQGKASVADEVLGEAGITYWLSSELKFKVTLFYVAQLLQLLSFMSLQFLYPFCQLGRRALYNYCFIYMYHKPIVLYIGAKRLFHLKLPP
jgi:hypothetical protein